MTRIFDSGWTLTGSAGSILSGTMGGDDRYPREYEIRPGFMASVRAAVPVQAENGMRPYISTEFTVSYASFTTELTTAGEQPGETASMTALDFMVGLTVGYTVGGRWQPYLAPRLFGGPVRWHDGGQELTGSDRHHYQLGLGSALLLSRAFTLFVDGSPLGARGITAGLVVSVR